jgi:hypothetical protein
LNITLEDKSAKEIINIEFLASRKRSRPRQLRKININIGCQSSFDTHSSQLQKFSAHCINLVSAQVWRVVVAATTATCIFSFRLVLDWDEPEDVMVVNTRNKSYTSKRKFDPPRTSSAPSSSSQSVDTQAVRTSSNQGVSSPLPSSKYNILNQLANIKEDATLLDMVVIQNNKSILRTLWKVRFLP